MALLYTQNEKITLDLRQQQHVQTEHITLTVLGKKLFWLSGS